MTELTNERDVLEAFEDWMRRRGPLGAGASPERIFIAGWAAARRATPSTEGASLPPLPPGAITEQEGVAGLRPYEFSVCGQSLRWYLKADVDALLARQSQEPQGQETSIHFYRQKGTSVWIECVADPRETFENSPAKACMEYRTLYAAPAHPVAQPAVRQVADTMDHAQLAALGEQQKGGAA